MARVAKREQDKKLLVLINNKSRQEKRSSLRNIIKSPEGRYTPEEKMQASFDLQSRKRNESKTRRVTRCRACGRNRSVLRDFNMCGHCVRKYVDLRYLPGMRKSSW
ncbi:MAG: uS14 family ribosomal protein [Pseudomonadota bacterium]|nr:uS14 family ribosomal protein [Pseudomonadota bacterium]